MEWPLNTLKPQRFLCHSAMLIAGYQKKSWYFVRIGAVGPKKLSPPRQCPSRLSSLEQPSVTSLFHSEPSKGCLFHSEQNTKPFKSLCDLWPAAPSLPWPLPSLPPTASSHWPSGYLLGTPSPGTDHVRTSALGGPSARNAPPPDIFLPPDRITKCLHPVTLPFLPALFFSSVLLKTWYAMHFPNLLVHFLSLNTRVNIVLFSFCFGSYCIPGTEKPVGVQ